MIFTGRPLIWTTLESLLNVAIRLAINSKKFHRLGPNPSPRLEIIGQKTIALLNTIASIIIRGKSMASINTIRTHCLTNEMITIATIQT